MKKYINVKTGKEVKIGEQFTDSIEKKINENNSITCSINCTVTEQMIPVLLKYGYIKKVNVPKTNPLINRVNIGEACTYTINAIAKRMHWEYNEMKEFLITLNNLYPEALRTTLYRVLSLEMNKNKEPKEMFYGIFPTEQMDIVTSFTVNVEDAISSKRHSFFINKKDAEYAVKIVQRIIDTFNAKGEQED